MVIETCPRCRADLMQLTLTTHPPIPKKVCQRCGWSWTGKPKQIVRIPFKPDE